MQKEEDVVETDITVLYEPQKGTNCAVDVLFVHGLQGNPKNTWVYKGAAASKWSAKFPRWLRWFFAAANTINEERCTEVFWPKDLLPSECPSARIMTWGYESKVSGFFGSSANQNSFYDHANDLLYALDRKRKDERERPLIFVMHSLGGIVVKQALIYSNLAEENPDLQLIESSTKALIFFGTPHRGSTYAAWGKLAAAIAAATLFDVNARNINVLESHGQPLAELEKSFGRLIRHDNFTIHNFQEAKGFKSVAYLNQRIVEPWSASIGDPGKERTETINANHMNMCRFSSVRDPGYVKASSEIASRVEELRKTKSDSMAKDYDKLMSELGSNVSIGIPTHVHDPQSGTFTWAIKDPRISSWLKHRHGVFAIKALSMLRALLHQLLEGDIDMYFLVLPELELEAKRSARDSMSSIEWTIKLVQRVLFLLVERAVGLRIFVLIDALDECNECDRSSVISFLDSWHQHACKTLNVLDICISSRPESGIDSDLSEVLTGSLLLQNENYRDIVTYVNERLGSKHDPRRLLNHYANFAATIAEMADGVFLWVVLVVPTLKRAIARGDTETELEGLLKQIPKELKELYKSILGKVDKDCLSITMRMMQIAVVAERPFRLDEFQHILAFPPNSRFTSFLEWENSSEYIERGPMMISRLQSRSGGLLEVCEAEDQLDGQSRRRQTLFKDYFDSHTKTRPKPFSRPQDNTSIPGNAVFDAEATQGDWRNMRKTPHRRPPFQWNDSQYIHSDYQSANEEINPSEKGQIIRLIHETAKNFFAYGEGFQILWDTIRESGDTFQDNPFASPDDSYLVAGHDYLVRCCAFYLDLREIRLGTQNVFKKGIRSQDREKFALLEYISESYLRHIGVADKGGLQQDWIMSNFISRIGNVETFICWACEHQILSWLDLAERLGGDFDATEHCYGRPIRIAVSKGHLSVVQRLIRGGVNVNGTTGGSNTTLLLANRRNNTEMVRLLQEHGAVMEQVHLLPPAGLVVRVDDRYVFD
ncbi:hypothetical protein EV356DRAFT_531340 [Viridothelium virens]|uniref:Nephrocystin 3-like N-terminal domain-containing protein n=1 Tax=Viridothelium virens TaxID=1048519 RepID=A0A6A6HD93_VIRVR|nr:hypothetical protein EV356DRAFT_531340 [Viridothelium virens]